MKKEYVSPHVQIISLDISTVAMSSCNFAMRMDDCETTQYK